MIRALLLLLALPVAALDTSARAALVIDHGTGTVLLSKDADVQLPPASMSKLMTLYMVFEALRDGRLTMDETVPVSETAWQIGGSSMFLEPRDNPTVRDILMGIIVQSGNDACVAIAEHLAGSEARFSQMMTERARELGMSSVFANSTGWPHPDHRMSARDLVFIAAEIISEFPEYYPMFAETTFTWNGIEQSNRNPLLALDIGADGLKTGHTQEAGYGLVGSAVSGEHRVVFMITGLESQRDRRVEAERLVSWAFREFSRQTLFDEGQVIERAEVWLGEARSVGLVPEGRLDVVIPFGADDAMRMELRYEGPIEAPIAAGSHIADLVIEVPELGVTHYPLLAAEDVARGGFTARMQAGARILIDRVFGGGEAAGG